MACPIIIRYHEGVQSYLVLDDNPSSLNEALKSLEADHDFLLEGDVFNEELIQQWVDFKYRSMEEALLDFNRAIKGANPEAVLVVNTWNAWVYGNGHNTRNSIRVAESVDGLLEETGWYDIVDPSFFAFPARHNFMNWHLAGLCQGKRALMWGAPSLAGRRPVGPLEARICVATMMTNGALPAHSVPGRDTLRTYMADITEREPPDAYLVLQGGLPEVERFVKGHRM